MVFFTSVSITKYIFISSTKKQLQSMPKKGFERNARKIQSEETLEASKLD